MLWGAANRHAIYSSLVQVYTGSGPREEFQNLHTVCGEGELWLERY